MDTQAATTKELYLTGSDDYSSITLGNVKDSFSFDVTIHNIGNKDQRLKYLTNLNTDGVENGKFTLKPRSLATIDGNDITVKANSTATVTITVDASTFAKESLGQFSSKCLKTLSNGLFINSNYINLV